jgi:hypothetical protein
MFLPLQTLHELQAKKKTMHIMVLNLVREVLGAGKDGGLVLLAEGLHSLFQLTIPRPLLTAVAR